MTEKFEKSRENRARRRLEKMGYALQKCRNRADIYHYGQYRIIEIKETLNKSMYS